MSKSLSKFLRMIPLRPLCCGKLRLLKYRAIPCPWLILLLYRQGKWKPDAAMKSVKAKSKLYSYEFDLEQQSDHPSFPYTLRDLTMWLLSNISSSNYVFRRQCMICLGELCPLLPLPENAIPPPTVSPSRPPHLQAIAAYLFEKTAGDDDSVDTVAASVASCIFGQLKSSANSLRKICDSGGVDDVMPDTVLLSEQLFDWLDSLNGALDSANWVVRCVDPFDYSHMLRIGQAGSNGQSQSTKRKRKTDTPAPAAASPSSDADGAVIMRNLLNFYRFCCRCLLGAADRDIVVSSQDALTTDRNLRNLQLKISEVFRRSVQFMTSLLEKNSSYFVELCSQHGLCSSDGSLSDTLQLLLLCSICVVNVGGSEHVTIDQSKLRDSLAAIADALQITHRLPSSASASELSFTSMLSKYMVRQEGHGAVNHIADVVVSEAADSSEEHLFHLYVAIDQLLVTLQSTFPQTPILSHLWKYALMSTFQSLSPVLSSPTAVSTLTGTLSMLKKRDLLHCPFSVHYRSVLFDFGIQILSAIGALLEGDTKLSPHQLEVGNMLLRLAVDCGISLGNEGQSVDSSLCRIVFKGLGAMSQGSRFIQQFGGTVVNIILGDTDTPNLSSHGVHFIGLLHRLSSTDAFISTAERHSCCTLLRHLLTAMVEKITILSVTDVASFLEKCSQYAVLEGREMGASQSGNCVICTYDNIMLLLHLESYIYRKNEIGTIPTLREFVLESVLGVFLSAGDAALSFVSFPCGLHGEKCDMIVRALGMLPYFVAGTVASCPRPSRWASALEGSSQEEEKTLQQVGADQEIPVLQYTYAHIYRHTHVMSTHISNHPPTHLPTYPPTYLLIYI